ncbi:Alpha beta hydrolase fold protein [Rutstroemia sp. NJR-2017a WRK4]|nr:Alpha beta hydrolase fold protein [Rutstroemia sp. NJR-2017a WRK4]
MPILQEISYSREATINAFRDYYRFIVDLYMDESEIKEPPEGGWPTFSPEYGRLSGKSEEVIALLRSLPCISQDCSNGDWFPPHGSAYCYWADWQWLSDLKDAGAGVDTRDYRETLNALTEACLDPVPAHFFGLTYGGRENPIFLLDTKLGIVHWPQSDGGGNHSHNIDNDPSFIEAVDLWDDLEELVSEKEFEWRMESPAWAITDFFELFKKQFRELKWIPMNAREVILVDLQRCPDGMIPMVQEIFRGHGWPSEEGGTYRKRECLEAAKAAMEEHYPGFGV